MASAIGAFDDVFGSAITGRIILIAFVITLIAIIMKCVVSVVACLTAYPVLKPDLLCD